MIKDDVYVAIVSKPFFAAEYMVLGVPIREHILKGLDGIAYGVFPCERTVIRPKCRYFALLYDDMPLVTKDALIVAAKRLKRSCCGRIGLGKGFIEDTAAPAAQKISLVEEEFLSVKGATELNIVYNRLKARRTAELAAAGVLIFGDAAVDFTATVEEGATLIGEVAVRGNSRIGREAVIDCSDVINSEIGASARIRRSVVEDSAVGSGTTVGPFAYIRGGSRVGRGVRIGDFVEIKNSALADGVKAAHLAYIGNAEVGADTNVGCGTVFCNYDGKNKHHTVVGERAFIGANTNLIAPVSVGSDCFIAAGSTVTDDVPDGAFTIARSRQINKTNKG